MPAMIQLRVIPLLFLLLLPLTGLAQLASEAPVLLGTFEGELTRGRDNMTLAFTFDTRAGQPTAAITSSALGVFGMPAESVAVEGMRVRISISRLDLEFYGTLRLSADGLSVARIDGDYYQQSEMVPVVLYPVSAPTF